MVHQSEEKYVDTYAQSREVEAKARQEDSAEAWEEFAELKLSKGSYGPAEMGYLNAGIAHERQGSGDGNEQAAQAYRKGMEIAQKAGHNDALLMLSTRLASLLERTGENKQAAGVYEELAEFYQTQEKWFLAADAADHAAEQLRAAGEDISSYLLPAQLWQRNAEYWSDKDAADEAWSRRREEVYLRSIGK